MLRVVRRRSEPSGTTSSSLQSIPTVVFVVAVVVVSGGGATGVVGVVGESNGMVRDWRCSSTGGADSCAVPSTMKSDRPVKLPRLPTLAPPDSTARSLMWNDRGVAGTPVLLVPEPAPM